MNSPPDGDRAPARAPAHSAAASADAPPPGPSTSNKAFARLSGIDAARGIAMVLVCLSHIRYRFEDIPAVYALLTNVTRIATPTFLLLSGFIATHVLSGARSGARIAVIDRGLFVLITGHLLLNLDQLAQVHWADWLFARVTVTDAIGISLVIGALCARLPVRVLLLCGLTLALVAWPIAITASTESETLRYLLIALFDIRNDHSSLVDAAVAPYLGLFLIGMALSKRWQHLIADRNYDALARKLFVTGAMTVIAVFATAVLWMMLKHGLIGLIGSQHTALLQQALTPTRKLPPSPAYLAFYSGAALLLAAACLARRPRAIMEPIVTWAATLGRTSLMCFVAQDWLLLTIPRMLGLDRVGGPAFWVSYFLFAIVVLYQLARHWDARGANRFLTIGLKHLANKRSAVKGQSRAAKHQPV
jgi:uncharacterized membrane protein